MIVNIFCYNEEIAKQNKNKISFTVFGVLCLIFLIGLYFFGDKENHSLIIIFFGVILIMIFLMCLRYIKSLKNKMTAWVVLENGRIYRLIAKNNGYELINRNIVQEDLATNHLRRQSQINDNVNVAGMASDIRVMQIAAKYMSDLEIVQQIAEDIPNVPGVEVFEILKVYSIQKKKRFTKVHFDCLRASDNKLFYNLTLKIENVYTNYNDLIKYISTHQVVNGKK